jgi:ribosome inactivating protein
MSFCVPTIFYIFGIRNSHAEFYFNDTAGLRIMGDQRLLGFGGHYSNLGSYADQSINRGTITAALTQIAHWRQDQEISNRSKETSQPTSEARHLLLLILMISEAARFFDIERTIANALDGSPDTPLTPQMIQTLTRQWGYLSRGGDYRQVAIRNLSP